MIQRQKFLLKLSNNIFSSKQKHGKPGTSKTKRPKESISLVTGSLSSSFRSLTHLLYYSLIFLNLLKSYQRSFELLGIILAYCNYKPHLEFPSYRFESSYFMGALFHHAF